MKNIVTIIFIYTTTIPIFSQSVEMYIEGEPKQINEPFEPRQDINGKFCGVIKVVSEMEGYKYDALNGVVGKIIDKPGADYVYLQDGERVLTVYHTGFQPLQILLRQIGIRLQHKQIWEIKITAERTAPELLPVSFIIKPEDAAIFIDEKAMGKGATFQLYTGKHEISIRNKGYLNMNDTISVTMDKVLFDYQLIIKPEMVSVEGGTFDMGDNFGDGREGEKPVHKVTLTRFHIGRYEVTQSQWVAVMGTNPAKFRGDSLPVESVSWYDVIEFCNKLSTLSGLTPCYSIDKTRPDPNNNQEEDKEKWIITCDFNANGYRLPTEAEWEYACRGGRRSANYKYAGSNNADEVAWNANDAGSQTDPVATKKPNELGIYDMSGNVDEWCWDWYGEGYYRSSPGQNPQGPRSGHGRVVRGGSWAGGSLYDDTGGVRCADRSYWGPSGHNSYYTGFRLFRTKVD